MNVPQPSEAARPAIPVRASDADREQAAAVLQAATADGRLPAAELDERLGLVYNATSKDELASIVKDLQPAPWPGGSPPVAKDAGVLAGHHLTGPQRQHDQQRAQPGPADLEELPRVGADLQRPEHRDLHVTILPGSG